MTGIFLLGFIFLGCCAAANAFRIDRLEDKIESEQFARDLDKLTDPHTTPEEREKILTRRKRGV